MYFLFPLMQCRLSACYNKMEWTLLEAYADIATCAEENMHAAGASHADCPTVALAAGFRGPMLFWCRVDGGGVALPHLMFCLCQSIWLFHLRNILKNTYFFSNFSLADSTILGVLLVVSLEFQEIKHQPFSMTQPFIKRLVSIIENNYI